MSYTRYWPSSGIQRLSEMPNPWPHHGWWQKKSLISRRSEPIFRFLWLWYISELLNLGGEITTPNSTLRCENLPELPSGFLHPHHYPNTPVTEDKRILSFFAKYHYRFFVITLSSNISVFFCYTKKLHTEVFERDI